MKIWRTLIAAPGLLLWSTVWLVAQVEIADNQANDHTPPYDVDAISFASLDTTLSRLDVFVQISYDRLSFVKEGDSYRASYELTISLSDTAGRLVSEKMWTEPIKAESFDQTVSSQATSLLTRSFELAPGRYYITTVLRDGETKIAKRVTRQLVVSDFHASRFSLSDIMLVSRMTQQGDKKSIVPSVSSNVGTISGGFYLFFEVYNGLGIDSAKLVATVFDEKKVKTLEIDTLQRLVPGRNQVFVKIDNSALPIGDYSIYIQAFPVRVDQTGLDQPLSTTSRSFLMRWLGVPAAIKNLDIAVDQLMYIAKDKELDDIREAKTREEKQKRFFEFWKKKDPNPNTPRNERMEAYYQRVDYANKHFKHYVDGWKTDMGMVYIIFGSPNNVERHPFDSDSKPYEVWSYYELNHSFVFVDQTGFGDYRLITPIWEVWQRPKD